MKIIELNFSKSCTIQIENFQPVTSFYATKVEVEKGDDIEKIKKEQDGMLTKWIEFERLKWTNPNRAITAGKNLGMYDNAPKIVDENGEELPF